MAANHIVVLKEGRKVEDGSWSPPPALIFQSGTMLWPDGPNDFPVGIFTIGQYPSSGRLIWISQGT